jgi:dTDP-4-dehydrorhamnose 3,5-epimerase
MTTTTTTPIDGCIVLGLHRMRDERGAFARAFSAPELAAAGAPFTVVQANLAVSAEPGTVRGMHYQVAPHGEQKFLRCVRGAVYDVVVDLRAASPTYRSWFGVELTAEDGLSVLVPRGCAHGYMSLRADSEVLYFVDAAYEPAAERVLSARHEDIAIDWPLPIAVQSDKDAAAPTTGEPPASGY